MPVRDPIRAVLLTALLVSWPHALSPQTPPALTWGGEIRPRVETERNGDESREQLTSMRTRIALTADFQEGMRLFFQFQDVRNWGEEVSERDRSADAIDFHQAYLEVADLPGVGGLIRAGRQEVALAEERFIGAPDWGQAGQTFDGAHWIRPLGKNRLELVALKLREESSAAHDEDAELLAAWYALPLGSAGSADLLALHDRSTGGDGTGQHTFGGVYRIDPGPLSFRVQGMLQRGDRDGREVRANMLLVRGGVKALEGRAEVSLWYDRLSGDDTPEDDRVGVFSALYGARNRYYGTADFFVDIPNDTGGLGLQDAVLKVALRPSSRLGVNVELHAFRTAVSTPYGSRRLGEEADAWVRYRFRDRLTVQTGYSLVDSGPVLEGLGRLEGTGHFGYVMTSLRF